MLKLEDVKLVLEVLELSENARNWLPERAQEQKIKAIKIMKFELRSAEARQKIDDLLIDGI